MSDEPEMNQLFVVVHGEAAVAEAFDTEIEADEFIDKIKDEYLSGPWTVNTGEKGKLEVVLPTYDEKGSHTHDYEKQTPVTIRADADAIRLILGKEDEGAPAVLVERRNDRWCLVVAHDGGGDGTVIMYIPDDKEKPIRTESNFGHHGGPEAEYTNG